MSEGELYRRLADRPFMTVYGESGAVQKVRLAQKARVVLDEAKKEFEAISELNLPLEGYILNFISWKKKWFGDAKP